MILVLATGSVLAAEPTLILEGLFAEALSIPVSLLMDLPQETVHVVAVNSAGEESPFSATGARFSDLLATYGKEQENMEKIRLIAGDGYSIEVPGHVLRERAIILAYLIDGKPLDERDAPLRVVIPEERAMYWVRNLSKIEVLAP